MKSRLLVLLASFSTAYAETLNATAAVELDESAKKRRFWLGSLHGMLMVVAWIFLAPTASMAARYLRSNTSRDNIVKIPNWFLLHRNMNYAAVILSVVSIIVILFSQGWRWTGPWPGMAKDPWGPGSLHSLFGAVSIGLAVLQPILAYFRPKPSAPQRASFNVWHRGLGVGALVFALAAMYLVAARFGKRFYAPSQVWFMWLVYLVGAVVAFIVLESIRRLTITPMRIDSDDSVELDDDKKGYNVSEYEMERRKLLRRASIVFTTFAGVSGVVAVMILGNMILKL
ncbi:unnamed protein product, partial [Mesorhabditis spiculigera]